MQLLTLAQCAERISCSVSHVRDLARAAELAGTPVDCVPLKLRRYLDSGFPRPRRFGRMVRVDAEQLERWAATPPAA